MTWNNCSGLNTPHYLSCDDICYYLAEYTARQGFTYSGGNDIVSNFKAGNNPNRQQYRNRAIEFFADSIAELQFSSKYNIYSCPNFKKKK